MVASKILRRNSTQSKLKIFLVDNTEQEWEIIASTPDELSSWFENLSRCAEKASITQHKPMEEEQEDSEKDLSNLTDEELIGKATLSFNKKPKRVSDE